MQCNNAIKCSIIDVTSSIYAQILTIIVGFRIDCAILYRLRIPRMENVPKKNVLYIPRKYDKHLQYIDCTCQE